jgi:hypothetical protein
MSSKDKKGFAMSSLCIDMNQCVLARQVALSLFAPVHQGLAKEMKAASVLGHRTMVASRTY